jgi:predicted HTH transcriptional regulator
MAEKKRINILEILSVLLGMFIIFKLISKQKVLPKEDENEEENLNHRFVSNSKSLNERQRGILKLMQKKKVVLPSQIYDLYPEVSTRTLRRDMDVLVELGFVRQEGSTRDTKYILNNHIYA